jgi:hypothetical protein
LVGAVADQNCKHRKGLLVEVDDGGMGQKLLALTSSILLSVYLDRSLFLDWKKTDKCGAAFEDLFVTTPFKIHQGAFYPTISNTSSNYGFHGDVMTVPNDKNRFAECKITLDDSRNYENFVILHDSFLLNRLDTECDIIRIKTNLYFASLIYSLGHRGTRLKNYFTDSPVHYF